MNSSQSNNNKRNSNFLEFDSEKTIEENKLNDYCEKNSESDEIKETNKKSRKISTFRLPPDKVNLKDENFIKSKWNNLREKFVKKKKDLSLKKDLHKNFQKFEEKNYKNSIQFLNSKVDMMKNKISKLKIFSIILFDKIETFNKTETDSSS